MNCPDCKALSERLAKVEQRLSEIEAKKKVKRTDICHIIPDGRGGKFLLPKCWGGLLHGKEGCYCK